MSLYEIFSLLCQENLYCYTKVCVYEYHNQTESLADLIFSMYISVLVSLFNGTSTFVGFFNTKAIHSSGTI